MNPEDIALAIIFGAFFMGIGVGAILVVVFGAVRKAMREPS